MDKIQLQTNTKLGEIFMVGIAICDLNTQLILSVCSEMVASDAFFARTSPTRQTS